MRPKPEWFFILALLCLIAVLLHIRLHSSLTPDDRDRRFLEREKIEGHEYNVTYFSYEERVHMLEREIEKTKRDLSACNDRNERFIEGVEEEVDTSTLELTHTQMIAWAKQVRPVDYVIGITASLARPSVGALHLVQTIHSILSTFPHDRIRIIVLSTDSNYLRGSMVTTHMELSFPNESKSGLIKVLRINYEAYPPSLLYNPCELSNNFNDSLRRVKWASKLAVDVAFLMEHASPLGTYYLHLEDDTPPIPTMFTEMDRSVRLLEEYGIERNRSDANAKIVVGGMYTHTQERHPDGFFLLRLCNERLLRLRMGAAFGQLYRAKDVPALARWLHRRFDMMPVDWNIGFFINRKHWESRVFTLKRCQLAHLGHESTKSGVDEGARIVLHGDYETWEQCEFEYPGFVMHHNATLNKEGEIKKPLPKPPVQLVPAPEVRENSVPNEEESE